MRIVPLTPGNLMFIACRTKLDLIFFSSSAEQIEGYSGSIYQLEVQCALHVFYFICETKVELRVVVMEVAKS